MSTLKLRAYQEEAATFLYERDRAMILAPVGAGKTALTLTALQEMIRDGHTKRWLVVAPKRVCTDVWPVEAPKWSGLTPALAVGSPAQREAALASDASVVVINYDNLMKLKTLEGFDGIVFDELTRLKNPSGARFKALDALIDSVPIRWGLTGSFTSNGLEDVFGQCKIIDRSLLGRSKGAFLQTYFVCTNRDFGDWSPRPHALTKVMEKIRPATYVLEAGEYADKLPPLHLVEVACDLDDRKPYETMKKQFVVEFAEGVITAKTAGTATNKLQQMASGFVYNTTRTASATPGKFNTTQDAIWFSQSKFDRLEELLAENQRDNTLIVYEYREELAELKRRYPQAQTLDDDRAIERWNAGKIEMLLVHPKSAGHGLNLQFGGHKIVFVSLPWSLELFEQTIGRLHRSGQTKPVWCYALLSNKTIDWTIWERLRDKRDLSDIALEELKNG